MQALILSTLSLVICCGANSFPSLDEETKWPGDLRLLEPLTSSIRDFVAKNQNDLGNRYLYQEDDLVAYCYCFKN